MIEAEKIKFTAKQEQGKAQSLEALILIGKQRGYKNPRFWAEKVFNNRKKPQKANPYPQMISRI